MNEAIAWIGIAIGVIAIMKIPLPPWRLLAALVAVSLISLGIGVGSSATRGVEEDHAKRLSTLLTCGLMAGAGIGYFIAWARTWKAPHKQQEAENIQRPCSFGKSA